MYKYIYFYANEALYCLEIQSQRFTAGKLSSCWSWFKHQDLWHTNAEKGANLGSIL